MKITPEENRYGNGIGSDKSICPDESGLCEKRLEILKEVSSAILVTDNINTIGHLILDLAMTHLQVEKGSLMMLNNHQELYILCSRGLDEQLARAYRVKIGEGVAGIVAQQGEPVLVTDLNEDNRFSRIQRDRYRTRSFISCPVMGRGGILGVLNINDKRDGSPFNEAEFSLVKILAEFASIALKNAFLVNQYKNKAAELEEVNRKLIDTDVAKTEFLTRMSHELRTPLNSIKGAIYYLKSAPHLEVEARDEFHEIINGETSKLISFVEKQLDYLRLQDEGRILKQSIINLNESIKETFSSRMLQSIFGKRNLKLELNLGEGSSEIVGDRILVNQLFINLLEGIVHHLEIGGKISLSSTENDVLKLVLEASNPLPDYVLKNFFHAKNFYFAEKAEEYTKLYLALRAAEVHGWNMKGDNFDDRFLLTIEIPKISSLKTSASISSSLDMALEFAAEVLGVNTCSIMLHDDLTGDLYIANALGLDDEIIKHTRIRLGDRIAGWVASEGQPVLVEDIEKDQRFRRKNIDNQYSSKSLLSVPLKKGDRVVGVLNLNNKKSGRTFHPSDMEVATIVGNRIAGLIDRLHAENITEDDLSRILSSLDELVQAERNSSKKDHKLMVTVRGIMENLPATEQDRALALYVSRVYDIGLALIDKGVLDKNLPLSTLERTTVKGHPHTAINLLEEIEPDPEVRKIVLHHHEHFDGTGYPDGLAGEDIPLLSRVLAVADAYCSMLEKRAYRRAFDENDALEEIRKESGCKYDPHIVRALETYHNDAVPSTL